MLMILQLTTALLLDTSDERGLSEKELGKPEIRFRRLLWISAKSTTVHQGSVVSVNVIYLDRVADCGAT